MNSIGSPHNFAQRLETALKIRRVGKMYALAVMIGVDESAISRWRRGRPISTKNLIKLCDALNLSIDWLLTGRGAMQAVDRNDADWSWLLASKFADLEPVHIARMAEIFYFLGDVCGSITVDGRK